MCKQILQNNKMNITRNSQSLSKLPESTELQNIIGHLQFQRRI